MCVVNRRLEVPKPTEFPHVRGHGCFSRCTCGKHVSECNDPFQCNVSALSRKIRSQQGYAQ